MKKVISIFLAIYFLLGSLSPRMDYQQLLHLACAVEHYSQHRAAALASGEVFTLTEFLMDHYLDPNNNQHEDDKQEHPCSHTHSHTVDFAKVDFPTTDIPRPEDVIPSNPFNQITSFRSSDFTSGLDQPPSFC